jgi:hypothetical protein
MPDPDPQVAKPKMDASDYYKMRLEHTITHLQQATRLIYFVSGGVIATFYFVFEKLKDDPAQRHLGVGLLVLLGLVNAVHALFIVAQGRWYQAFDAKLAERVGVSRVIRPSRFSSSGLHAGLHWLVAAAALIFASWLFWTGWNVRI